MVPRVTNERLSNARRLRMEMTAADAMLRLSLRDRGTGAKFRRQVPICTYVAGFARVAARLVVELDGRPHDAEEQQAHDECRDVWLSRQGWCVLRIPNDIVIGGGDIVIDRIRAALTPQVPSSDPR